MQFVGYFPVDIVESRLSPIQKDRIVFDADYEYVIPKSHLYDGKMWIIDFEKGNGVSCYKVISH